MEDGRLPMQTATTPAEPATSGDVDADQLADRESLGFTYRETLLAVLIDGADVPGVGGQSVGSGKSTRELLNFSLQLSNARDRIVPISNRLRSVLAVGRFLWMMAGSDRLDDIRFYESKGLAGDRRQGVGSFSDDGLSVPGSNYGQRLFRPGPGVDQVQACIDLIKEDPNTRRAAMSVYRPEDAGRESPDIPCTFGAFLNPRDGMLNLTVIMRSNNAWILLPYNVFEFTLLGEVMASETGLQLGPYFHFAASMHLYEDHVEPAREAIGADELSLEPFPEMPAKSLQRVRDLCVWESSIRHRHRGLTKRAVQSELKVLASHGEYWSAFGRVVLAKALLNANKEELAKEVAASTRGPLGQLLRLDLGVDAGGVMKKSTIETPSDEALRRVHRERSTLTEEDRTRGRFHVMMLQEQLRSRKPASSD
jgi:thymidylate synthase